MKPKLLISINTLSFGGAERVVSQLLNHLNEHYEIHLVLFSRVISYPIPENIKILDLQQNMNAGNISTLLKIPLLARKVAAYCKKNGIRVSVSFLNRPCYMNAFMKTLWGFKGKTIMCERSHQSSILNYIGGGSKMYKVITKKLISFSYNNADLVLANSIVSKEDLLANFGVRKPIEVIYNPIDLTSIDQVSGQPTAHALEENVFHFISTGNFRIEKNFPLLVEAFSQLPDLPVKLILVGGGALENTLRQQVAKAGMNDKVIFTGFEKNPFSYIKKSDCFVLSSYTEGFPNVLLEALACGKPVISTDCKSGPRELLAPGTPVLQQVQKDYEIAAYGLLAAVNDATCLAKAMRKMYTDNSLRLDFSEKARLRAMDFDVYKIKNEFIKAFQPKPHS